MYEPQFAPTLFDVGACFSGLSFGVKYSDVYRRKNDVRAERAHIHPYLEIFFNVNSDVSFLIGGVLYSVGRGEAVISRANEVHVCDYNSDTSQEHMCLWIDAPESSVFYDFLKRNGESPHIIFDGRQREEVFAKLERLAALSIGAKTHSLEACALLLDVLLIIEKGGANIESAQAVIPKQLEKIISDIDENCAVIHSVSEICQRHFISRATLGRWFKNYIRLTPREYLESKKLSEAVRLLLDGVGVTDACFGAGFSDTSHFIGLFKRKFGKTPLAYKKSFDEK